MRIRVLLSLVVFAFFLAACNLLTGVSSLSFNEGTAGGDSGAGEGGPLTSDDGAVIDSPTSLDGSPVPGADSGPAAPTGTHLASSTTLVIEGMTGDGYIVYGDTSSNTLYAISANASAGTTPTTLGVADLGETYVLHDVVTFFAHATNRVGPLSVWTSSMTAPRQIATSSLETDFTNGEYTIAVSADSAYVLYFDQVDPTASTGTLFLGALAGGGGQTQLVGPVDVAEDHCHPEIHFSASYALASYCVVAGTGSKLPDAGTNYDLATLSSWLTTSPSQQLVASGVQTVFSADPDGGAVVGYGPSGMFAASPTSGGATTTIDALGSDFFLTGVGTEIVYTTSQEVLKHSSASVANSTQLAAAGTFTSLDALSTDQKWVIGYLHTATSGGTSDLYAASTSVAGSPTALTTATTGSAGSSGDSFTSDSSYALFQTGYASNIGTLNALKLGASGSPAVLAQGNYVTWALIGTTIAFNANYASEKADLQWIDVAKGGSPTTLVSAADPLFLVTPAKDKIAYTWSGAGSSAGLWVITPPGTMTTGGGSCIDAGFTGFKAAAGAKGSCNAADVTSFYNACLSPSGTTCSTIQSTIGAPCFDCLVSEQSASTWGALVLGTENVFVNVGGCYAVESATEQACATAFEAETQCEVDECGAVNDGGLSACVSSEVSGACSCTISATNGACAPFSTSACAVPATDTFQQLFMAVAGVMCE